MIAVYIKTYLDEFKTREEAEKYLDKAGYEFDEFTQPLFVNVEEEAEK